MNPLISVIMSIYNEKKEWIQEAVESILNQTYSNIQFLIVVDNPALEQNILNYLSLKQSTDNRIEIYYNDENIGLAKSLNKALEYAKGEYIARMDADDISELNRFEIQIKQMLNNNYDFMGTGRIIIDENDNVIEQFKAPICDGFTIRKILPYGSCFVHPTVMIKTEILKKVGGYRNFRQSQDYDLWLRLLTNNCSFGNVNQPLLKYRIRTSGITKKKPYVQYLTSKYQKRLFKERKRKGVDSFSEIGFELFLNRHNAFSEKKNKKFQKSLDILNISIGKMKRKDVRCFVLALKSFLIFPEIISVLVEKILIVINLK